MAEPELICEIAIFRDKDGYAASWEQGGTWDHATPSDALEVVGGALDEWNPPVTRPTPTTPTEGETEA